MKVQFENRIMSSLLLFIDNYLLKQGEAFTNYSSLFYPVKNLYNSYYTYAAPFKQMVNDDNVPNAVVMKTIYVNGDEKSVGASNFHGINHFQGQINFLEEKIAGKHTLVGGDLVVGVTENVSNYTGDKIKGG